MSFRWICRTSRCWLRSAALIGSLLLGLTGFAASGSEADEVSNHPVPEDFPCFTVPGCERDMQSLRQMFWLHYQPAGPLIPLWDDWMPMATLWPATGTGTNLPTMRSRWASALASRIMDAEGYVLTMQHDGPAHAEGWPFPQWQKHGGVGWHFRGTGVPGYDPPPATPQGWQLTNARAGEIDERGWVVELTAPGATAQTPPFELPARYGPWLRLNWWAEGLEQANCYVEWVTKEEKEFSLERRFYFAPAPPSGEPHSYMPMGGGGGKLVTIQGETRTMIPVYRLPGWKGTITGLRISFDNSGPARVTLKSFHTAHDTRFTVNNLNFIRGVHDYFVWTWDLNLLRRQVARVRTAMRFIMREFDTLKRKCIYTTWPGHEGRSGVRLTRDGHKEIFIGEGIGGNYWDLLPFGGEDALATIYYYDTLLDLADLEEQIAIHPEWGIATGADAFNAADLRRHAHEVKTHGTKRFWNRTTGRFGTVDLDGVMHDYGWTFLNNEAVYYDFATDKQARLIRDWISGRRTVVEDTSTGADIYRWRFGPRASTRRNLDYYYWGWPSPETNAWGSRLQDGGAVFGFSYHDLMCRLKVDGPDDAWNRLEQVLAWFRETQAEGGYRRYYENDKSRGSAQGGKEPGGVGIDMEFFESVLVPQVMLYGFLGFEPTAEGCKINPQLPRQWPELRISRVHLHDVVLAVTARSDRTILIQADTQSELPMVIELPKGKWHSDAPEARIAGNRVTIAFPAGKTIELIQGVIPQLMNRTKP
jgi:hypothetical protein